MLIKIKNKVYAVMPTTLKVVGVGDFVDRNDKVWYTAFLVGDIVSPNHFLETELILDYLNSDQWFESMDSAQDAGYEYWKKELKISHSKCYR